VRKDLAFLVKGGLPVPTYVLEYLLGQYCASDDEVVINEGLEKVKQVIKNNYVHRAESESVKGIIREHGKHRIIDKVTVVLNEKNDEYNATFANLGLSGVPIGTEYVRKNPKLLSGNGVWCIVTIGYVSGEDVKVRWEIQTLKPVQISNIDLQYYIDQRKNFTTEEWIDTLLSAMEYDPEGFSLWHIEYNNEPGEFITLFRTVIVKGDILLQLKYFKKYCFGVLGVYGSDGDYKISGCMMWRGKEIPDEIKEIHCYNKLTLRKLDVKEKRDQQLVHDYWTKIKENEKVFKRPAIDTRYFY
jgi:hypothetical protein